MRFEDINRVSFSEFGIRQLIQEQDFNSRNRNVIYRALMKLNEM